jgi:acyl carrier protein
MEHLNTSYSAKEIQSWLTSQISQRLELEPEDIDIREPFTNLGLSSREAVVISGALEDWLGCRLSPTLLYEYPSIETISQYLFQGPDTPITSVITNKGHESGDKDEMIAIIGIGCRPEQVARKLFGIFYETG